MNLTLVQATEGIQTSKNNIPKSIKIKFMILVNTQRGELQITIPGSEGEYVAIMQSLVKGLMNIPEREDNSSDCRQCLGALLLAILPGENNIILEKINGNG